MEGALEEGAAAGRAALAFFFGVLSAGALPGAASFFEVAVDSDFESDFVSLFALSFDGASLDVFEASAFAPSSYDELR